LNAWESALRLAEKTKTYFEAQGEVMDAPAFDARWVRPALRSIAFCFSAIMISSMTMVKPAHASGTLSTPPSLQYSVSWWVTWTNTSLGNYTYTNTPISCSASSVAGLEPCVAAVAGGPVWFYTYDGNYTGGNPGGFTDAVASHIGCPDHSQPTGSTCTCNDPSPLNPTAYVPDPTGTSCVPVSTCPVTKLDDITDPVALKYEDGTYSSTNPDIEHLNQATQAGLACIVQKVVATNCYQTPQATSGYRPAAYQKHIYDVYYKWQKIKDNNTLECAEVKAAIKIEFKFHSNFARAPGKTSKHSQMDAQGNPAGNAVDISPVSESIADSVAGQCNMRRPMINMPNPKDNDPVHYQPK
jgi:hypothetical protein